MKCRNAMKKSLGLLLTLLIGIAGSVPALAAGPVKLSYANFPRDPTFPCVQMEG